MALPSLIDETSRRIHLESKTCFDVKHDGNTVLSRPRDELLISTDEVKHHKVSVDGVPNKINVQKRRADDLNSETSAVIKERKSSNLRSTLDHVEKPSTSEKSILPSSKVDLLLFFLRFRSHAYQKSLVLSSPPTKNAVPEVHATNDHASASPVVKPVE
ncbi:hypothetical protein KIW84_015361 [Lathyrus oleraceus]|uniref:Uncharacterized protein n=1 Tax=Pisum sativum TaxID=3888 RepID=A0A9D5BQW9_PEA|nr:hypothetical protein KIW84_015361 [Pisum sativum]